MQAGQPNIGRLEASALDGPRPFRMAAGQRSPSSTCRIKVFLAAVRFDAVSVKPSNRQTAATMTDGRARSFTVLVLLLCAISPCKAQQPQPDVIRGHVTSDSGRIVPASVTVVRGPDRLTQQTTTDSAGNYRVRFDEGTGDYLVTVASPGLRTARRRVQRQGTERELVANFVLAVDLTVEQKGLCLVVIYDVGAR